VELAGHEPLVGVQVRGGDPQEVNRLRSASTVAYLDRHLPAGIMVILVVYLLRDTALTRPPFGAVQLVPVAVTVATHFWKRHTLLSMAEGTLTYAALLALPL